MFEEKLFEEISSDEDEEKDGMPTSSSRSTIASISAAADSTQPICPPPPPPPILAPINFSNRPPIKQQEIQPTSSKTSSIERRPPIPLNRIEFGKRETPISFKTKRKYASTSTPIPSSNSMDLGKAEQDWLVEEEEEEPIGENEELERIMDSPYWTQSIAPGKFYKRTRDGGQIATPALCNLQQEFAQRVIGTIRTGQTAQPHSEPPNGQNTHQSCGNCPNHHHSHSEDENSSNGESSSIFSSSLSSSSSICSSPSLESAEEEGELGNSADEEEFDGKRKKRRKMGGGRRKRRGRERKSHQMEGKKGRHGNGLKSAANIATRNEIERKRTHPAALHPDIGFNEPGQLNDGPLCKCSWAARQSGVRHGKYRGEQPIPRCNWQSSNIDRLHHYVLQLDPDPAQFSRQFTQIQMDGHFYKFDGFSVFFHQPLPEYFPQRPINQWNQQYQVRLLNENAPESFTVNDLELFHTFLFDQVLELYDLDRNLNIQNADGDCCLFYHCLPRFARKLPDNGKELLPMSSVLAHFLSTFSPLIDDQLCRHFRSNPRALAEFARTNKGQICVNPTKRPMAIRMDLLDSGAEAGIGQRNFGVGQNDFPLITHFGIKPTAYAYMKKPEYQNALHKHFELRKKLAQKTSPISLEEKWELKKCKELVETLKKECKARRDSILHLSSHNFYSTGLFPDIIQHSLFLVLACQHIRFHCSLDSLEKQQLGGYTFRNRSLLELALIHPSFRTNYGTNSDHAKNVLNNCGIRMSKLTKAKEEHKMKGMGGTKLETPPPPATPNLCQSGRRKGIRMLMEIMAMQGCPTPNNGGESPSLDEKIVRHNERLEFLGDTVVELLTTVHLFFLFTDLDEGGLATFRSALVQNRHLATLADRLGLQHYMVYAHGPDLCHEADLRHAMANTFEALMGAIYLDSGLAECDRIFGHALFKDDPKLLAIWNHLPEHPLKRDSPFGDRHLIESIPCLKNLAQFEESIGIRFKHIRLLAKAFTRRNVPYNYLTLGHNQRLEFLGDTILQLLTTDYLYRHFPHHQEGHLSLLRTCLVSNRTQSVVCDDLAMSNYLVVPQSILRKCPQAQLRLKDKADLVESFLGALYIDRGLRYCRQFCQVCFFPRLKYFILNQSWNDPKSRLQQCCLTLRDPKTRGEPDIPKYKTIGIEGPTNTRVYRVAVYFRKKRLAIGCGASMHIAQMEAAKNALAENSHIFPSIFNQNEEENGKEEEGNYENIFENEERKKGSRKRKATSPIH